MANGLSAERLARQLDVVAELNEELAPFRILTGIECDINADGSLDQTDELLARVDVVVASVHSDLRAPASQMTPRMLAAVANPHTDVLGHCTGRLLVERTQRGGKQQKPRPRAPSTPRPCSPPASSTAPRWRSTPGPSGSTRRPAAGPGRGAGCDFSIDTDAHAPGQLDWQGAGCERAAAAGITADRVINTRTAEDLLAR